jgi:hypothetical protein
MQQQLEKEVKTKITVLHNLKRKTTSNKNKWCYYQPTSVTPQDIIKNCLTLPYLHSAHRLTPSSYSLSRITKVEYFPQKDWSSRLGEQTLEKSATTPEKKRKKKLAVTTVIARSYIPYLTGVYIKKTRGSSPPCHSHSTLHITSNTINY